MISLCLIDSKVPNIISRSRKLINVVTGFRCIDYLFPIGYGQRELIIGDRQTGKSILNVSMIINQLTNSYEVFYRKINFGIICLIANKCSNVMKLYELFNRNYVLINTVFIYSSIINSMSLNFISPLVATSISEYFRNQSFNSIIIYDDLSKHSISYRQLSLYLRKAAGREAFPSDIFYIHARLLERTCCLNYIKLNGTITCLPIIETLSNDLSAFVATNIISITDGQLHLDSVLFGLGIYPSISIDKSVSRVGAKSLDNLWRSIAFKLYSLLNEFKQEIDAAVKSIIFIVRKHRWDRIYSLFIQRSSIYHYFNVIIIVIALHGLSDLISIKYIKLLELCLLYFDLIVLSIFGIIFDYCLMFNWIVYLLFRIIVFKYLILINVLFIYLDLFSFVFRLYIQRRIIKLSIFHLSLIINLIGFVKYLTCIKWSWTNDQCIINVYQLISLRLLLDSLSCILSIDINCLVYLDFISIWLFNNH